MSEWQIRNSQWTLLSLPASDIWMTMMKWCVNQTVPQEAEGNLRLAVKSIKTSPADISLVFGNKKQTDFEKDHSQRRRLISNLAVSSTDLRRLATAIDQFHWSSGTDKQATISSHPPLVRWLPFYETAELRASRFLRRFIDITDEWEHEFVIEGTSRHRSLAHVIVYKSEEGHLPFR